MPNTTFLRRRASLFSHALGLLLLVGCNQSAPRSSIDVPLDYRPNNADPLPAISLPSGETKLYVSPTTDTRSDTRQIGENRQKDSPIPVYAAAQTPADFVTEVLRRELQDVGLSVSDDASDSKRQINSEITRFNVEEGGNYKADVSLRVKVVDQTGKTLWEGVGSGSGTNWGRSMSTENYQQTLSDALRRAVGQVLANPAFVKALGE